MSKCSTGSAIPEQKRNVRYREIARKLARQIESKVFAPNERLPSVRELMKQENISLTTAGRVFQMLETEGKVYARPRSGFFVRPQRTSAYPGNGPAHAGEACAGPWPVASLDNSIPDCPLPPLRPANENPPPALRRLLNRILKVIASDSTKNHLEGVPANGLRELRCGVARIMDGRGVMCGPDDIIITPCFRRTVETALHAVARPGDTIATDTTSYASYRKILDSLRLNIVVLASNPSSGIDIPALRQFIQSRAVRAVLLQPLRATGEGAIPDYCRRHVLDLIEKSGIVLIEDDPYHDVFPETSRLVTFKSLDRTGRVIYCSSFAPVVGAGYQIGWCVAGRYTESALQVIRERDIRGCALPQFVLAELLRKGYYAAHVKELHVAEQTNMQVRTREVA